jgi:hypothetical protein
MNNYRSGPTSAPMSSPFLGTPRPTPSQATNPIARPAAAIPNNAAWDYRSPRPIDETAQPLRSSSEPSGTVPANSTSSSSPYAPSAVSTTRPSVVASPVMQPRAMPMAPTAYGSPLAVPPYCSSIQSVIMEPNWQPCDGYADEGE